ncbi:MAG: TldD/PmbA family protein [Anaerolineae bacterium]|nr:TldD/PmbA family protein [Anaerolineae bacterium]
MKGQLSADDLLRKLPPQVEAGEVYEVHSLETPVQFAAGTLESIKSVETAGRALRVIQQGRLGFATTSDLADDTLLLQSALGAAEFGGPAPFSFPDQQPPAAVQCFDAAVEQLSESEMIALGKEAIATIQAAYPNVQVFCDIHKVITDIRIRNTSGLAVESRRTHLSVEVAAQRTQEGDILFLGDEISSRQRKDVDIGPLTAYIVERLGQVERPARATPGAMPIVFHRNALAALFLPLMFGLNGRYVLQGASPLGDKLGQPACAPGFELIDDPRLDFAPSAAPYDDEGVPTCRKALIQGGVVQQFLYDLRTAGQAGTQSTGNGFKGGLFGGGWSTSPDIVPGTWIVPPGEKSLEQILTAFDEVLLVEDILGLGQGNTMAGEFSNNVALGFLVRRGEIVGRVKNTMIAGNVYALLRDNLIAVADQPQQVYGWLQIPAIALDGVSVAC